MHQQHLVTNLNTRMAGSFWYLGRTQLMPCVTAQRKKKKKATRLWFDAATLNSLACHDLQYDSWVDISCKGRLEFSAHQPRRHGRSTSISIRSICREDSRALLRVQSKTPSSSPVFMTIYIVYSNISFSYKEYYQVYYVKWANCYRTKSWLLFSFPNLQFVLSILPFI